MGGGNDGLRGVKRWVDGMGYQISCWDQLIGCVDRMY